MKLTAPALSHACFVFDRGSRNTEPKTRLEIEAGLRLWDALNDLAPLPKNDEAKEIWVHAPRGTLEDYEEFNGTFEERAAWDDVSSYEEHIKSWNDSFPPDGSWYDLIVAKGKNYIAVSLDRSMILCADTEAEPLEHDYHYENYIEEVLAALTEAAKSSMDMVRNGTYSDAIEKGLPYWQRTGVVRRKAIFDAMPDYRDSIWDGLSDDVYQEFKTACATGIKYPEHRIKNMTGNTFLEACTVGYRACGYEGVTDDLVANYMRFADGRDEGLTGQGHGLHAGDGLGIDLDSPDEWSAWYHDRNRGGGHPWEVCRGGNSTHVSLYVAEDDGGWYFICDGNAWNRAVETVKFYVALKKAGCPVCLNNAKEILARFDGEDYVGIVPASVFPSYCSELFPSKYGKILDFMHVDKEDMDAFGDKIEWLKEDEPKLLSKITTQKSTA